MYTAWKVGDRIRMCVKVEDFCGEQYKFLHLYSGDIQKEPDQCNITCRNPPDCTYSCIDTRGREVVFRAAGSYIQSVGDAKCSALNAHKFYPEMGRAVSDPVYGISTLLHTVSEQDRTNYQDAIANDLTYDILCCMNDPLAGARAFVFPGITVSPVSEPTHAVQFKLAFVPPEIADMFDQYIGQISAGIMAHLNPLPSPWTYVRTTYDRVENAFMMWFSLPEGQGVAAMSAIDDLFYWAGNALLIIIGLILIIISPFIAPSVLFLYALYIVGVIIFSYALYSLILGKKIAEEAAKNWQVLAEIKTNLDKLNEILNTQWENSPKTQSDCTKYRLEGKRDAHIKGNIDMLAEKYAKYSGFVSALNSEKKSFLTSANNIINEFKAKPYSIDVCNTYFSLMDTAVTASIVRVNDLTTQYIDPNQPHDLTCKGWTNQADCEKAECYWYNGACHKEENCWIGNPLGGCILSANTGKVIVGTVALLAVLGGAYWLATRKPQEVRSIYYGAKEAATAEAQRAKELYERIRPPAVPATAVRRAGA